MMETGTPQESLAPSSFLAGGQPVLCIGPEWGDRRLELAGNGGAPRMLGLVGFEAKKGVLKGGEGYGPGFLVSGHRGSWAPSLGAGGGQDSWVLGKGRTEHLDSWVPGEKGAESQDS